MLLFKLSTNDFMTAFVAILGVNYPKIALNGISSVLYGFILKSLGIIGWELKKLL